MKLDNTQYKKYLLEPGRGGGGVRAGEGKGEGLFYFGHVG